MAAGKLTRRRFLISAAASAVGIYVTGGKAQAQPAPCLAGAVPVCGGGRTLIADITGCSTPAPPDCPYTNTPQIPCSEFLDYSKKCGTIESTGVQCADTWGATTMQFFETLNCSPVHTKHHP